MAKSHSNVITLSALLLFMTTMLLILSPKCYADQSELDGPDTTIVSKDSVCVCGMDCGYPCMYYSPPPPSLVQPPSEMPPPSEMTPPEMPSPELYSPPPPSWPWPTPPYPWYIPPPPRGQVYAADGGFEFIKPSLAWRRGVSWAQVLVSGVILLHLL